MRKSMVAAVTAALGFGIMSQAAQANWREYQVDHPQGYLVVDVGQYSHHSPGSSSNELYGQIYDDGGMELTRFHGHSR